MNNSPPPGTPDFAGAATAQGAANLTAAQRQALLNNPNFYGVGGSQTVTYGPDGQPTVRQSLSPQQQQLYNQFLGNQGAAGSAARGLLGSGQFGGQFDTSGLSSMGSTLDPNSLPAMPGNYNSIRDRVIEAMMGRADTELGQRSDQMNSDLVARGLRPGTEAYTREQDALGRQRNDAMAQAELAGGNAASQALQGDLARRGMATGEQAQGFGQDQARRTMGLQELLAGRQIPFSEYTALMGGSQYQTPTMPSFQGNTQVAPEPVYGAATATANYNTDIWNALMQQQNSRNSGYMNLGNSFLNSNVGSNLINQIPGWLSSLFGSGS